jgi:sugar lactone lactonase YvrE
MSRRMNASVERVGDITPQLGEGPAWDERDSALWWLDIPGEALHRYDPDSGDDSVWSLGQQVGSLAPRASGGLVLATPDGFVAFDPATGKRSLLAAVEQDNVLTRMNDGKCDRQGRYFAGTMAYDFAGGAGSFYRLDPDGSVTRLLERVTISNGLAWSADDTTLYYIDSMAGGVDAFDFDASTGSISGRRQAIKIEMSEGIPDGMCIDAEDCLWVALYGGACVRRYSPDGELLGVVEVPAKNVTCCAFAGPDLDELYITAVGGLYRCRPGVRGVPVNAFAGCPA